MGKKQFTIFFYNLQGRPRESQETQGDRIDVKFPISHPLSSLKLIKSLILPSHPHIPTPTTFHFLPSTYLFNPDFSLLPSFSGQFSVHPILYLLSSSSARAWSCVSFGGKTLEGSSFYNRFSRSGEIKLTNERSFIIWLSGEGFISFSINNRTNFFGEKKVKWSVPGRQLLFENTRKNLAFILVLVLKSKALYYS